MFVPLSLVLSPTKHVKGPIKQTVGKETVNPGLNLWFLDFYVRLYDFYLDALLWKGAKLNSRSGGKKKNLEYG